MRILHVIKRLDYGGAENYTRELCNSLADTGNDVFVFARGGRNRLRLDKRITFIGTRFFDFALPVHVLQLARLLKKHRIEVVHAHQRFPTLVAVLAGMIAKVPVVTTVHGVVHHDLPSAVAKKGVAAVLCVNRYTQRKAELVKSLKGKTHFIPNALTFYAEERERVPGQLCYASRIDQRHSTLICMLINEVIPAMEPDFPGLKLVVVGDGQYLEQVKSDALRLNDALGREACVVKGYMNDPSEVLCESQVALAVGRVALDALANATPVLSVNFKRMGELISTDNFEFYDNHNFVAVQQPAPDAGKIVAELRKLFSDTECWQRQAEEISRTLHRTHNRDTITAQIEAIYRDVITHKA